MKRTTEGQKANSASCDKGCWYACYSRCKQVLLMGAEERGGDSQAKCIHEILFQGFYFTWHLYLCLLKAQNVTYWNIKGWKQWQWSDFHGLENEQWFVKASGWGQNLCHCLIFPLGFPIRGKKRGRTIKTEQSCHWKACSPMWKAYNHICPASALRILYFFPWKPLSLAS